MYKNPAKISILFEFGCITTMDFCYICPNQHKNVEDNEFMKHSILTIFVFATLQLSNANICAQAPKGEFMMVADKKIKVDDKLCYQIRKGISRKDTAKWELFCGEFTYFYYQDSVQYKLYVKKYDPQADTIRVIRDITNHLGRSNPFW